MGQAAVERISDVTTTQYMVDSARTTSRSVPGAYPYAVGEMRASPRATTRSGGGGASGCGGLGALRGFGTRGTRFRARAMYLPHFAPRPRWPAGRHTPNYKVQTTVVFTPPMN